MHDFQLIILAHKVASVCVCSASPSPPPSLLKCELDGRSWDSHPGSKNGIHMLRIAESAYPGTPTSGLLHKIKLFKTLLD